MQHATNYLTALLVIDKIKSQIINPLIGFLLAISFLYFLYGIYELISTGDSKKMEEGKKHVIWGLVGLFIIVAVTGIMSLVAGTVSSLVG